MGSAMVGVAASIHRFGPPTADNHGALRFGLHSQGAALLTNEDDGGRLLACGAEEGADAGGSHALEHLHEFRAVGCR